VGVSVDHTRDNHLCLILLSVGGGVDQRPYLLDESIAHEDLTIRDNTIRNGVDLTSSDKDGLGLSGYRNVDHGGYEYPN
jgi:hypothetical protein